MDYLRIYDEFIKNRRERETALSGYTEKHHIVPRCMGGGDEAGNIIRLTAEDHFFAHLCLAKAYGGTLWTPLAYMVGGSRKDYVPIKSRKRYSWVLPTMARKLSGEGAYQYDWTIYNLENKDHVKWSGTQRAMHDELGLTRSLANLLIKGKVRSAKGWYKQGNRPSRIGRGTAGSAHHAYDPQLIVFVHSSGIKFSGTRYEFSQQFNIPSVNVWSLVHRQRTVTHGWSIEGVTPSKLGRALAGNHLSPLATGNPVSQSEIQVIRLPQLWDRGLSGRGRPGLTNPRADQTKYAFRVISTGNIIISTRYEMSRHLGIRPGKLWPIFRGKCKQTHGVALIGPA